MTNLYYTPPSDEIFKEVKEKAIEVWRTYDDTYNYASEKVDRIKDLENIKDNVMYMIAMFDIHNQVKLSKLLSDEANKVIRNRMVDGGNHPDYIVF